MGGRGSTESAACPVDAEAVDAAETVVVGVGPEVGLGIDVEKLVMVKEMEIEETAQKSFASSIVCSNSFGQRKETHLITNV